MLPVKLRSQTTARLKAEYYIIQPVPNLVEEPSEKDAQ